MAEKFNQKHIVDNPQVALMIIQKVPKWRDVMELSPSLLTKDFLSEIVILDNRAYELVPAHLKREVAGKIIHHPTVKEYFYLTVGRDLLSEIPIASEILKRWSHLYSLFPENVRYDIGILTDLIERGVILLADHILAACLNNPQVFLILPEMYFRNITIIVEIVEKFPYLYKILPENIKELPQIRALVGKYLAAK